MIKDAGCYSKRRLTSFAEVARISWTNVRCSSTQLRSNQIPTRRSRSRIHLQRSFCRDLRARTSLKTCQLLKSHRFHNRQNQRQIISKVSALRQRWGSLRSSWSQTSWKRKRSHLSRKIWKRSSSRGKIYTWARINWLKKRKSNSLWSNVTSFPLRYTTSEALVDPTCIKSLFRNNQCIGHLKKSISRTICDRNRIGTKHRQNHCEKHS